MKTLLLLLLLLALPARAECVMEQLQGDAVLNITGQTGDAFQTFQYRLVCESATRADLSVTATNGVSEIPVTVFIEGSAPDAPLSVDIGPEGSLVQVMVVVHVGGGLRARNEHNIRVETKMTY